MYFTRKIYKGDDYSTIVLVLRDIEKEYGHLTYILNHEYQNATVIFFEVKEQCKGYGSLLMAEFLKDAKAKNMRRILVDDMSDRYRQPNNIYKKFGFWYLKDSGPEMLKVIN